MTSNKETYLNKDISKILGIAESTLRKWCIELEKNGYVFDRGYKESRLFSKKDLNVLTHYKELSTKGSYTLNQIAGIVVGRFNDVLEESKVTYNSNESQSIEKGIDRMNNLLEEILSVNKLIYEEIKKKNDPAN